MRLILLITFISSLSYAQVPVSGYYNNRGTYVQPYMRSAPDAIKENNMGYRPQPVVNTPSYFDNNMHRHYNHSGSLNLNNND